MRNPPIGPLWGEQIAPHRTRYAYNRLEGEQQLLHRVTDLGQEGRGHVDDVPRLHQHIGGQITAANRLDVDLVDYRLAVFDTDDPNLTRRSEIRESTHLSDDFDDASGLDERKRNLGADFPQNGDVGARGQVGRTI